MPVVTGQDAEIASVKLIADGVQSSTIFKDTRLLAEQAVIAAKAYLGGGAGGQRHQDVRQRRQGRAVLPAPGRDVYKDNIQKELVDTGYWTAEEVASGQSS